MANKYTKAKPDMKRMKELYKSGMTQVEVAKEMGLTQKIVWRCLRDAKVICRKAAARCQGGSNNNNWRGDKAGYYAFHRRLDTKRGKLKRCEICGKTEGKFEWANITGNYKNENDYLRMCVLCHRRHDLSKKYEHINKKAKLLLNL